MRVASPPIALTAPRRAPGTGPPSSLPPSLPPGRRPRASAACPYGLPSSAPAALPNAESGAALPQAVQKPGKAGGSAAVHMLQRTNKQRRGKVYMLQGAPLDTWQIPCTLQKVTACEGNVSLHLCKRHLIQCNSAKKMHILWRKHSEGTVSSWRPQESCYPTLNIACEGTVGWMLVD